MGPFVSASHPLVASGEIDALPTELFEQHIARRLARLMERSPSTMVILVPSTEDIFHPHCAFPQPFFDKTDPALGLPKRVRCLPNPSVFYVNELAIGVTTADVLSDLRREELVQRVQPTNATGTPAPKAGDPMMRLTRHLLGQRRYVSGLTQLLPPLSALHCFADTVGFITLALVRLGPTYARFTALAVAQSQVVRACGRLDRGGEPWDTGTARRRRSAIVVCACTGRPIAPRQRVPQWGRGGRTDHARVVQPRTCRSRSYIDSIMDYGIQGR